ncbi:MAG: hypothetical protein H7Y18_08560 [Clostridiaceae bacterium]|nr:hypothetical protein [Clostridiaceae bacterium]
MTNFRSLNSSEANLQSVKDHAEEARVSKTEQNIEKKEYAFNKYNVNGEKRRGEGEEGH